ncbi:restriction endonuclease subunit S [Nonomuraea jabiensis]|uniref:Type I restriction enzyme S subunit n=1 Tax=Nonomuraea jabiensis TaxID=882448 RepID=A0A7W9FYU0_9ACTN|nr:restriction endonuclease subunit S [Nonomuraea jabiensis]MBB5774053.1 type I restriction enzyme S subunit [Nonomuraea jabiensis]
MALPERPLGEAITLARCSVSVNADHEYRIAGIYSFGRGLIKRPTITGNETAYKALSRLNTGQLVMSKLNAWEGALTVVPEEFSGAHVSPEYPVFDIIEAEADVRYISHLVSWPTLWDRLTPRGSMVRRKRTTPTTLMSTPVPLPDLDEQRRIAARLDAATANLSRVEQLQEQRSKLQAAFKESLIADSLANDPDEWAVGEVIRLTRRQVDVAENDTYREIGIRSFGRGVFHKEPVTGAELGGKRVFAIEPGDLLFSNVFAWEGAVALAGDAERGYIGSHRFMTYLVDTERADASYLRHYFTSSAGLEVIRRSSPGSAGRNKTLGIKNFEAQHILLPSLPEQQRIGRHLDALAVGLSMSKGPEFVKALRPSLLNAAFSGQL